MYMVGVGVGGFPFWLSSEPQSNSILPSSIGASCVSVATCV